MSPDTFTKPVLDRRKLLKGSAALASISGGMKFTSAEIGIAARPNTRFQDDHLSRLTIASNWAPFNLDPHASYDPGSGLAMTAQFESLITLKPGTTSAFLPSLAQSWSANEDNSVWTFNLRPGVTFHDGSPMDATAVKSSFERLFALGLAPSTVLGRFLESADQIDAQDNLTVSFDLGSPQPMFERAMAAPYGTAIVNAALALQHDVNGDWGHAWAQTDTTGLGTGPYRISRMEFGESFTLERYEDYWQSWGGDHFSHVTVRTVSEAETRRELIERGEADIVQNLALEAIDDLQGNTDVAVVRGTNLTVRYLAMTIGGPLESAAVRQAMCWAFPYTEVLEGVLMEFAKPARGPVNERCHGFASSARTYETDLEMASMLIREAGYGDGMTLSIANPAGNPINQSIAALFQANLSRIGVDLDILNLDNAAYAEMVFGDSPAKERVSFFPGAWGPDYDDAYSHLWPQLSCDAWHAGNAGLYCESRVDELLESAKLASDDQTFLDSMSEVQRIVTDDSPSGIYFAQPEWITVLRADVGGYVLNPVVNGIFDYYSLHRLAT